MARIAFLVLVALSLAVPGKGASQDLPGAPRAEVSVQMGTMGFTDLQIQEVLAERLDELDETPQVATLTRHTRAQSGRIASASIGIGLGGPWSARVGGGLGTARLEHAFSGPDEWVVEVRDSVAVDRDRIDLLILSAALQYWVPTRHAFRPYIEVGLAAERWEWETDVAGGAVAREEATRWAGHAAVGGSYPLTSRLGVAVRAGTTVRRTPATPVDPGTPLGGGPGLVLTAGPVAGSGVADAAVETVRSTRIDVGLTLRLGRLPATPPPSPPESADPSPPPPR
jgi:hypothetical protein